MTTRPRATVSAVGRHFGALTLMLTVFGGAVLTGAVTTIGFYYVTNWRLAANEEALKTEKAEREQRFQDFEARRAKAAEEAKTALAEDRASRDKLREVFLKNSQETTRGILSLAADAKVQNEQIKMFDRQLTTITNKLDETLSLARGRGQR